MDLFTFIIMSIVALIMVHFICYYHNIDIIEIVSPGNKNEDTNIVQNKEDDIEVNSMGQIEDIKEKHIKELQLSLQELK